MPHVVTDNCLDCRFTDCVAVCPVECFHVGARRLYIDPDVCIDCSACIPECPVQAIYDSIDMPAEYEKWTEINAKRSKELPVIDSKQEPLPTAEKRKAELGF
jgi:ferredoxin